MTVLAGKHPGFPDETIHYVFIAIDAVLVALGLGCVRIGRALAKKEPWVDKWFGVILAVLLLAALVTALSKLGKLLPRFF